MPTIGWDILLITDEQVPSGLLPSVTCALKVEGAAGRVAVLLRAKRTPLRARQQLAEQLRALTAPRGIPLLIHGDVDLAREVRADGVHLPSRGASPRRVRSQLGPDAYLGRSCHDRLELEFESASLDYATLSPFFAVAGKAPPLRPAVAAQLIALAPLPIFALGGIGADEVPRALSCGAHGVAVIRSVLGAANPDQALRALLSAVDRARAQHPTPA